MLRTHPNTTKRLRTPATRGDDAFFPLSKSVPRATSLQYQTLPRSYAENLHAPFEVAKNLYYKESQADERQSDMNSPSLLEIVSGGNPGNAPRHFFKEETWKTLTKSDVEYAFGMTDVVLNGFRKETQWRNVIVRPVRPSLEKTQFDPIPGEPGAHEELPSIEGYEARAHLESFKELRFLWAGCPQICRSGDTVSPGNHCCDETSRDALFGTFEARKKHRFNKLHKRIECEKNKGIHCMVGNLNLNAKTANNANYMHCYSIRSDRNPRLNAQIRPILRDNNLVEHGIMNNFNHIAEWEFGVLEEDSSLQMSLANERKRKLHHESQPFLSSSPTHQREIEKLTTSLPGPPMANHSQRFHFASFYRRQIKKRNWPDYNKQEKVRPRPISDRSK